MSAYLVTGSAFAALMFMLGSIGWSRGLTRSELITEIVQTVALTLLVGAFWPLCLLSLAVVLIWDRL